MESRGAWVTRARTSTGPVPGAAGGVMIVTSESEITLQFGAGRPPTYTRVCAVNCEPWSHTDVPPAWPPVAHDIAIRKGGRVPDGARDTSAAATAVPASSRPPTTYGIADGLPSEFWRRSCGAAAIAGAELRRAAFAVRDEPSVRALYSARRAS